MPFASRTQNIKYLKNRRVYVLSNVRYGVSYSASQLQLSKDLIEKTVT